MKSIGSPGGMSLVFVLTTMATLLLFAPAAIAQDEEFEISEMDEFEERSYGSMTDEIEDGPPESDTPRFGTVGAYGIAAAGRISPPVTKRIVDGINESFVFCDAGVPDEYLASCLADQLKQISEAMAKTGEYSEAQVILAEAAVKMQKLVAANRAPGKPRLRVQGRVGANAVRSRPLTPVRKEAVPQVNAAASKILEEAETKLLRSAEASDRRLIAYAQMARAVGSNKVLLRSA